MVGRQKFTEAEWAFNWPHLRQLLKARNIRAHTRPKGDEKSTFDLQNARRRLGLSQEQLAKGLNVTARTLQNWEAGKGTSQMYKKIRDLRELLSRMDDASWLQRRGNGFLRHLKRSLDELPRN